VKIGTTILLSGGQDSVTSLFWAQREAASGRLPGPLAALTFFYGQRHAVETSYAEKVAREADVPLHLLGLDILSALNQPSALVNAGLDVASASAHNDGLPASFVPGRNIFFFTTAAVWASWRGCSHLVSGVCQTDFSGYPDCRRKFVDALELALTLGLEKPVHIHTPLMMLTKAQTWALARELGVLETVRQDSHTCYQGDHHTEQPWGYGCGTCPACLVRGRGWKEFIRDSTTQTIRSW